MIVLLMSEHTLHVSIFKGALNRYPKIPFTNTFEIRFFVSVEYDEIRCGGSSFQTRQHC
jgi:hypothetical protein